MIEPTDLAHHSAGGRRAHLPVCRLGECGGERAGNAGDACVLNHCCGNTDLSFIVASQTGSLSLGLAFGESTTVTLSVDYLDASLPSRH